MKRNRAKQNKNARTVSAADRPAYQVAPSGFESWRQWPMGFTAVFVIGILLRFLFLSWKSPHFDEGINGHFVAQIWSQGWFHYDPSNFHGPLYFYYLQLAQVLFGPGTLAFRIATVFLSVAVVLVTAMHARFLGRAALWAATLLALSTGMVFYGRYAIHETGFILAQVVFSYGFLRWRFLGGRAAVYCMIGALAASIAMKETFFIFFVTWAIAWAMVNVAEKIWPSTWGAERLAGSGQPVGGKAVWYTTAVVAALVVCALFSGFFVYPKGMSDMLSAYTFWTKTGTGATGHEKPFFYWVQLLSLYEWPALVALLVAPIACLFGSAWMRLYTLVGFGTWLAYSLIPYKTPWCVIGFLWPLSFAFGFLMTELPERLTTGLAGAQSGLLTRARVARWGPVAVGVVSLLAGVYVCLRLNFRDFHKIGEPYVYVQSTEDVGQVLNLLERRVQMAPQDRNMRIQVLNRDSWPFPSLLDRYPRVEFAGVASAANLTGDVLFIDLNDAASVEPRLSRRYLRRRLWIRDSYNDGYAYFDYERFRDLFAEGTPLIGPSAPVEGRPDVRRPAEATK